MFRIFAAILISSILMTACFESENPLKEDELPIISSIYPNIGVPGDTMTIEGVRFGAVRDTNIVRIKDIIVEDYISWNDNLIKLVIPEGVVSSEVKVKVYHYTSNGQNFTAMPTKITMKTMFLDTLYMGDTTKYAELDEKPIRKLAMQKAISISTIEVNQALWRYFMRYNNSRYQHDSLPVENFSFAEACTFCNKMSEKDNLTPAYVINGGQVTWNKTAKGYRLPTEAEWEMACRAESYNQDTYAGNISQENCSELDEAMDGVAWYCGNNSETYLDKWEFTKPFARKAANNYGLFDMLGNAWELCWDYYAPYDENDLVNPSGPETGNLRVIRGGAFDSDPTECRMSNRETFSQDKTVTLRIIKYE